MPANIRVDQRGITGLETAIVLIAFVVVASVFAFAVLNTGLLSSEKSKEAALGGLEETSATLSIRGKVIADANAGKTAIDTLKFNLLAGIDDGSSPDQPSSGPGTLGGMRIAVEGLGILAVYTLVLVEIGDHGAGGGQVDRLG